MIYLHLQSRSQIFDPNIFFFLTTKMRKNTRDNHFSQDIQPRMLIIGFVDATDRDT